MAWTAPADWTTGQVVDADDMNTHVRDNLKYLKGQAGAVLIENEIQFHNDTGFVARIASSNPTIVVDSNDFLDYVRASNHWRVVVASTEVARVASDGLILSGTALRSCLRGVDGNARHIESGNVVSSSLAQYVYENQSPTFAIAFGGTPNVTEGHKNDTAGEPGNSEAYVSAISTTGCTIRLRNTDGSSHSVRAYWMAEGTE